MADNLPLIPDKRGVCADVRPVLREVFKELDYLPPLAPERHKSIPINVDDNNSIQPEVNQWIEKYDSERNMIWAREEELKQEYAKRISRNPLPNIYKLYTRPKDQIKVPTWKTEQGILQRSDLMPTLVQNSNRDNSLWVKNILTRSSGELTPVVDVQKMKLPVCLHMSEESTLLSVSIGDALPHRLQLPPPTPPAPSPPEHILCVPPELAFVNFTVGKLHTQSIRLVNVSKFEVRLSVRPPRRRDLDVELSGSRGLTVTSGAAAEIRVHFRPRDVRALHDVLLVRVSTGKALYVPITCYMQPPILDILVPAVSLAIFSCTPDNAENNIPQSSDCLELGARLIGDVHCVNVLFYCEAQHAAFFLLTEDAWISFCLNTVTTDGCVLADPFIVYPAYWRGAGAVRGCVWCRAPCTPRAVGLHTAALRIVCSTAVVRPLSLIADVLFFRPDHITLEGHEKDYDICSAEDPACEYYVHLGTAFPHRSLSATVQVINHSPVSYSYYWSVRVWGECSCWEEFNSEETGSEGSERLCPGAKEAKERESKSYQDSRRSRNAECLRVEPLRSSMAPRSTCSLHVCAPDVGEALGLQRAVLMLVLKDIPKESFTDGYDPFIIKTDIVESDPIPGIKPWTREVCEVVCAQMEVWWEVVPVRFALDPPVLPLTYSRRVDSLAVEIRATQLFGPKSIECSWQVPSHVQPTPASLELASTYSCGVTLKYQLPELPDGRPVTDVITLEAANKEWVSTCCITRQREVPRPPVLQPARAWFGMAPPGARLRAHLELINDTYQHLSWSAEVIRWFGGTQPGAACGEREPCAQCRVRACCCAPLRPARGDLVLGNTTEIVSDVSAPMIDGCVATLVHVQCNSGDVAGFSGDVDGSTTGDVTGTTDVGTAALLAYRVLAPRLIVRVLPCYGDKRLECEGCGIDEGDINSSRGTATLRPKSALTLGRKICYRLRISNLTPLPTQVKWDPGLEDDILRVMFIPKEFKVGSYAHTDIQVVLEARKVCVRRLHVHRALVLHAYKPIYLVIDAAISGVEIVCEVPLGGGEKTDSTVIMRRTQMEDHPQDSDKAKPKSVKEMFEEEDKKRAMVADNTCGCHYEEVYIEPVKRPRPPQSGDSHRQIEIVCEPPPMTKLCPCYTSTKPILPELKETCCLQFERLPLRTVRTRNLTIHNKSALSAKWTTAIRNWPRHHNRTIDEDQWAGDVRAPGVVLQCTPRRGVLSARGRLDVRVQVYADCWGLYRDQLLIQIDNLEPIVLDVWVEAVGPPLQFAINSTHNENKPPVLCWMTVSDPERTLRVKNVSREELTVHTYTMTEHGHPQDVLPFRLYVRLFDVLPPTCPCVTVFENENTYDVSSLDSKGSVESSSSIIIEMDTGIELYLAPDYGIQDTSFYKVTPESTSIPPGEWFTWAVNLLVPPHSEVAPPGAVLLRPVPVVNIGEGWFRPDPPAQKVTVRQSAREGRLSLSCCEVRVTMCALDLFGDVMRIRKYFCVKNVGNGPLDISARTEEPWSVVVGAGHARCGAGCECANREGVLRETETNLYLLPRSSEQMCVEVRVSISEVCLPRFVPPPSPSLPPFERVSSPELHIGRDRADEYEQWRRTTTKLFFYDNDNVLETLPLKLELEYPKISIEPNVIDFGFVTDGDSRKSYFSVIHSSSTVSLDLVAEWAGGQEFTLWPRRFELGPGSRERIYIQYTARWCGAPVEGEVSVFPSLGSVWCRATARARGAPARDRARRAITHDYTDDTCLLPPAAIV